MILMNLISRNCPPSFRYQRLCRFNKSTLARNYEELEWSEFLNQPKFNLKKLDQLIPSHIPRPPYILNPKKYQGTQQKLSELRLKTPEERRKIQKAGQVAKSCLQKVGEHIRPGITTRKLDQIALEWILSHGAYPSPLGYHGFPASICTSVNNVVCHGIPDDRPLKEGDLISVDVTAFLDGYHGDTCATFLCSNVFSAAEECDKEAKLLCDRAKEILMAGIQSCKVGRPLSIIADTICELAETYGYGVVDVACGHGIGQDFHEQPIVQHQRNHDALVLKPGMVFTIEPVISSQPAPSVAMWPDRWTVVTQDGSRTVQFEHTVAIDESGQAIILTQ